MRGGLILGGGQPPVMRADAEDNLPRFKYCTVVSLSLRKANFWSDVFHRRVSQSVSLIHTKLCTDWCELHNRDVTAQWTRQNRVGTGVQTFKIFCALILHLILFCLLDISEIIFTFFLCNKL